MKSCMTFLHMIILSALCACGASDSTAGQADKAASENPAGAPRVSALRRGEMQTFDLGNGVNLEMVYLEGGSFLMGSPDSEEGREPIEGPVHEVELDGFYIGKYHVTVAQFRCFVEETSYESNAEKAGESYGPGGRSGTWEIQKGLSWKNTGVEQTEAHPVVNVDWEDANAFCVWLSARTKQTFRLPTEAEWEFACRAGTRTAYQWGDAPNDGKGWLNGADQSLQRQHGERTGGFEFDDGYVYPSPVGIYRPNAWGLYDMHGNVWQWCSDWHGADYYQNSPPKNPQGPSAGEERVLRGGSWRVRPANCRSAMRYKTIPSRTGYTIGFRVVAEPAPR